MDLVVNLTGARCATCATSCVSTETQKINLFTEAHAMHQILFVGIVASPLEMEGFSVDIEPMFIRSPYLS